MYSTFKIAGLAAALVITGAAVTAAPASAQPTGDPVILAGSSTQNKGGLSCYNQWFRTAGQTNCTGTGSQKWRLHLSCQAQPDIYGDWQYGPGSDQNECNFRISGASVQWG